MDDSVRQEMTHYLSRECPGAFLLDEPLSAHTSYRIGGPADFFCFPRNRQQLHGLLSKCRQLELPFFFMGEGANVLVHDNGIRGVAIDLSRGFGGADWEGPTVVAGAGMPLRKLIYQAEVRGYSGLEHLSGIPGTVGGALTMNAGTDSGTIGDRIEKVVVLEESGAERMLSFSEIGFSYRHSPGLRHRVILFGYLRLTPGVSDELREYRLALLKRRAAKQPLEFSSCGSVFKRPQGFYVGKLVEELGLKGTTKGDAAISEKHGGFIVNMGSASACDVMWLIDLVRGRVKDVYGVDLELEVRLLGFE